MFIISFPIENLEDSEQILNWPCTKKLYEFSWEFPLIMGSSVVKTCSHFFNLKKKKKKSGIGGGILPRVWALLGPELVLD